MHKKTTSPGTGEKESRLHTIFTASREWIDMTKYQFTNAVKTIRSSMSVYMRNIDFFQFHPLPPHLPHPERHLRHVRRAALGGTNTDQESQGKLVRAALRGHHPLRRPGAHGGALLRVREKLHEFGGDYVHMESSIK